MTEAPLLSFQPAWTALTTITVLPNSSEASGTFNVKPKPNLAVFAGYELSPFDTFDIRRFAETRFSPNESALIELRFSEASLVTADWLITAPGPGTPEGDQR